MSARAVLNPEFESQPDDVRELPSKKRNALWVSMIRVDGLWVGVSRYEDRFWQLGGSKRNVSRSKLRLDFDLVPAAFQTSAREILYRYIRRGMPGGKRPKERSVLRMFDNLVPLFRYLSESGLSSVAEVDEAVCKQYVDLSKATKKKLGKAPTDLPLAETTLSIRFRAVEQFYALSQYTATPMQAPPWVGASAAGLAGDTEPTGGKTPLIPDADFERLFQAAIGDLERADEMLHLRDELDLIERTHSGLHSGTVRQYKNARLDRAGWTGGLVVFNKALVDLRTACYIVVASLTGCRIHELSSVSNEPCYATEGDDGEVYWWMRGVSTKTDEGPTVWMIPPVGVEALRVMGWSAKPYQALVAAELKERRRVNPLDPLIADAQDHLHALFLGTRANAPTIARTLTTSAWNDNLRDYAERHGIAWRFASHQFRRKFANYAARSRFGDLRYLKEHFKHWAMDMTLSYALNESQEMALFIEMDEELADIKRGVVRDWLDSSEPLAGGYGDNLVAWRDGEGVTMFKDRRAMVISIADSTAIRSTGHSWCTADDDLCVGNDMERTRCTDCDSAVIGRAHARIYQHMYDELKATLRLDDIGPGGIARVERDLARCRTNLQRLGYDPEKAAA